MKNKKRIKHPVVIFIVITVTLIFSTIIIASITETIDNISLSPGDYGNADVLRKQ